MNVNIIHEDDDVLVINKPANLSVHPGAGATDEETLADWFIAKYPEAENTGEGKYRSGIVHRLDKDTTGVMVLAKNQEAYQLLKSQFQDRSVIKQYLALVHGVPKEESGIIDQPLARSPKDRRRMTVMNSPNSRDAITHWRVKQRLGEYTLLELTPKTGRTHQLRAHLHYLGHPIVGDQLYKFKKLKGPENITGQLLHAHSLTIQLPSSSTPQTFTAPIPQNFNDLL